MTVLDNLDSGSFGNKKFQVEYWIRKTAFCRRIKTVLYCVVLTLFLICPLTVFPASLSSIIGNFSHATTAMIVQSTSGKILYQKNPIVPMQPASDTKILTAVAALQLLGPSFRFMSFVKKLGQNYYFVLNGDPTLRVSDLAKMVGQLKRKGVSHISGIVSISSNAFKGSSHGLGIVSDDLAYGFAAPITGIMVNENTVFLSFKQTSSGLKFNTPSGFKVSNQLRFVSQKTLKTCVFRPSMNASNDIMLGGCLPNKKSWQFKFAIANPRLYAVKVLKILLKKAGIKVDGGVVSMNAPVSAQVLIRHRSNTLGVMLGHMLRYSDNIYAGSLTKQIGKVYYGVGSMKAGVSAIDAIVSKMSGIKLDQVELEDGAGASRYNHISVKAMSAVLLAAYQNRVIRQWLYRDLPISGQTGTLAYRMGRQPLSGKVRAKTGSMRGVSTLAGYIKTRSGKTRIFSIMMNNFTVSLRKARRVQDKLLARVYAVL